MSTPSSTRHSIIAQAAHRQMTDLLAHPPVRRPRWTLDQISLDRWISAAQARDLPVIPIDRVGEAPIDDLMQAIDQKPTPSVEALFQAIAQRQTPHTMFRWDCCAPEDLKYCLGTGQADWSPRYLHPTLDDCRLADLSWEYPGDSLVLWQRPWVPALRYARYPVEFRVFIAAHQIQGISSYYPQVTLEQSPAIYAAVETVRRLSTRLLDAVADCTHDWLITPTGEALFLEGGPPHLATGGAHPCCFPVGKIAGVALGPQPGALAT